MSYNTLVHTCNLPLQPMLLLLLLLLSRFSRVLLFATLWTAACQASLSITNSRSSLKLMSIKSVMPSSHLILCRPLFLLPLLEKTLESPLACKEIQPVHPKGNQF